MRLVVVCSLLLVASESVRGGPADEECERLRAAGIQLLARAEDEMRPRGAGGVPDVGESRRLQAAAVAKFEQALRLCPEDSENPFWLGTAHIVRGDADGYARALSVLQSLAPQDVRVDYLRAHFHLQLGQRPDLAAAGFERVRTRFPSFRPQQLSILLWRAYMDWGEARTNEAIRSHASPGSEVFEDALTQYGKAVREGEPSPLRVYMARRNLAQVLRLGNEFPRAEGVYQLLLRGSPDDPVVHYGMATVLADQHKYAQAIPHWEQAMRLRDRVRANEPTKMEDLRLRYGVTLLYAGRSADAKIQLETYVAGAPEDVRGWYYLGVYERDHPFDVVLRALEKPGGGEGTSAAPRDPAARRTEVAKTLASLLGKPEAEAAALLDTLPAVLVRGVSEEEADRIEDGLEPLGVQVELVPDFERAIAHLERSRTLDPACEDAARALLSIYTVMKPDPERAKALAAWLDDDAFKRQREEVRRGRVLRRSDRTEGCR